MFLKGYAASIVAHLGHRLILMQDNATVNKSWITREDFRNTNLHLWKAFAKSPDLNIIKNVGDMISGKLNKRQRVVKITKVLLQKII